MLVLPHQHARDGYNNTRRHTRDALREVVGEATPTTAKNRTAADRERGLDVDDYLVKNTGGRK